MSKDAFVLDLVGKSHREANAMIKECVKGGCKRIKIVNQKSIHYLAAGLTGDVEMAVDGDVGYYVGTMINGPRISISGRAGWYPADNMTSGEIILSGDGGDGAGQGMYDGTLYVKGGTQSRTGQIMKNGTIIVGKDTRFLTGLYMMGGRIIVLGDVGKCAGESIIGGAIYFAGGCESLGKNAKIEEDVGDEEAGELEKTLKKYGIKKKAEDFRKITPVKLRPFYSRMEEG